MIKLQTSELIDNLQLEDLSSEQRELADVIGLESYKRLITIYGGSSIYIPKVDNFLRADRNDRIKQEFNGWNFKELSQKYDLTEVQIRNIVNDMVHVARSRPGEGQTSLFDLNADAS